MHPPVQTAKRVLPPFYFTDRGIQRNLLVSPSTVREFKLHISPKDGWITSSNFWEERMKKEKEENRREISPFFHMLAGFAPHRVHEFPTSFTSSNKKKTLHIWLRNFKNQLTLQSLVIQGGWQNFNPSMDGDNLVTWPVVYPPFSLQVFMYISLFYSKFEVLWGTPHSLSLKKS